MASDRESALHLQIDLKINSAKNDAAFVSNALSGGGNRIIEMSDVTLPAPDARLGSTGLDVADFLEQFRRGERGLKAAALEYGKQLHDCLFPAHSDIGNAWAEQLAHARNSNRGIRLGIRLKRGQAAHWHGTPIFELPFELLADANGFLFQRVGWHAVRLVRGFDDRTARPRENGANPALLVAWANVCLEPGGTALPEADFITHETAATQLAEAGHLRSVEPVRHASLRRLSTALRTVQPTALVWVGHGSSAGAKLLLHDDDQPDPAMDLGVEVDAEDFARAARAGKVDVALLWSCHGAGTRQPLSNGVAETLLDPEHGDLLAVVASFSALESAAIAELSRGLFDACANETEGELETALMQARGRLDAASLTWARPVLFTRAAEPRIDLFAPPPVPATLPGPGRGWVGLPTLPAAASNYIDQTDRLRQLDDALANHAIVVIEGEGGLGKTALALACAHARRAAGRNAVFIDITDKRGIALLTQSLWQLVSEDLHYVSDEELFARFRGFDGVLVIDNAEDLLEDDGGQRDLAAVLDGLAAASARLRCVVTSRKHLEHPTRASLRRIQPALLGDAEARALFIATASRRLAPADADSPALTALLDLLGGLPQAIVLMAGQLDGEAGVAELVARLHERGAAAIQAAMPQDRARRRDENLLVSLELSLAAAERAHPDSRPLFEALGGFPAGAEQNLLPDTGFGALSDALLALLNLNLVRLEGEARRVVMSVPVRLAAWEQWRRRAQAEPERAGLLHTMWRRLLQRWEAIGDSIGSEQSTGALHYFQTDYANLLHALEQLPTEAGDVPLLGAAHERVVFAFRYSGQAGGAFAALATVWHRWDAETAPNELRAAAIAGQAALHAQVDQTDESVEHHFRALGLYRQIGARLGEANTLQALGELKQRGADLAGARAPHAP
ncbi:ATP-binding protein, partial [Derxia lacustris]|uniref:ATP-binding protein n=1 Tax=Derxia lacustris TaxID=764842 RepID=UPI00111C2E91